MCPKAETRSAYGVCNLFGHRRCDAGSNAGTWVARRHGAVGLLAITFTAGEDGERVYQTLTWQVTAQSVWRSKRSRLC
jgi:hypothetical protein